MPFRVGLSTLAPQAWWPAGPASKRQRQDCQVGLNYSRLSPREEATCRAGDWPGRWGTPLPVSGGTRRALQGLIPRSRAKSTTFRYNLISFAINTPRKRRPCGSILPVATAARLWAALAVWNARGACSGIQSCDQPGPGEGGGGAGAAALLARLSLL